MVIEQHPADCRSDPAVQAAVLPRESPSRDTVRRLAVWDERTANSQWPGRTGWRPWVRTGSGLQGFFDGLVSLQSRVTSKFVENQE